MAGAHGAKAQPAQLKPEPQLAFEAPHGPAATELLPPMPPGTEMSFSTSSELQLGHAGAEAELEKMIFSYLTPHRVQRYS